MRTWPRSTMSLSFLSTAFRKHSRLKAGRLKVMRSPIRPWARSSLGRKLSRWSSALLRCWEIPRLRHGCVKRIVRVKLWAVRLPCCLRGCLRIGASSCSIRPRRIFMTLQNPCSARRSNGPPNSMRHCSGAARGPKRRGITLQVKVTSATTLLFEVKNGSRTVVHRRNNGANGGEFAVGEERISPKELADQIEQAPEKFSPNVLFRPVVQDYLLPTLVYTGGAAEVAYFAQAAVVYEKLLGRVTPILPRFSATLLEAKAERILTRYQ